jgi:ferredoxin-NADP reductase
LPDGLTFGCPLGAHVKFFATIGGSRCGRSYTPVSDVLQTGTADFVIKIYRAGENSEYPEGGKMTRYLESLNVGDTITMMGPGGKLSYFGNG